MVRSKKVAVAGRFSELDDLGWMCRLAVLERLPGPGDLPDPACEHVPPARDYIFITATALINKTLPRILDLSRNAPIFLVVPSTPYAPLLFGHGIHAPAGTVVVVPASVWRAVQEGAARGVFDRGAQMVKVSSQAWHKSRE
jgi:hypothetical protein